MSLIHAILWLCILPFAASSSFSGIESSCKGEDDTSCLVDMEHTDDMTVDELGVHFIQKKSQSRHAQIPTVLEDAPRVLVRTGEGVQQATAAPTTVTTTIAAFAPSAVQDGKALPLNCTGHGKPIQVMKVGKSFSVRSLEVETGSYDTIMDIPYELVKGFFSDINACGISPRDGIMYCAMYSALTSYIVRMSPGVVEFVVRLRSWVMYNTGGFSSSGVFFIANSTSHFLVIDNLHELKGSNDKNDPSILNLANAPVMKPKGWVATADVVTFKKDFSGDGKLEEFLMSLHGATVQIAQWDGKAFTNTWIVPITGGSWKDIWGAGWSFNGKVFFASNTGRGVFEVPIHSMTLSNFSSGIALKVTGKSARSSFNDGMNCLNAPDPWVTKVFPFPCELHPAPIQTVVSSEGMSVKKLDLVNGALHDIYDIPWTRTTPKFRFLNAVGMNPVDHIPYAALMIDKPPGNMYIVRFDFEKVEFVAKIDGSFNAIAGTFDATGNYFFLSHPDFGNGTLYKIKGLDSMKGYANPLNESLADLSNISGKKMDSMYQMADIVAISYAAGEERITDYVLGINRDEQVIVVKWDDNVATAEVAEAWRFRTNDVLGKYKAKLNFGAAWNFQGRIMFASNDGVGVFEAVSYNTTTGYVQLQEVGKSLSLKITDGFNCPSASPFWGNVSQVIAPKMGSLW